MKIDIKHFALAAAGATMLLTSCIGDLDTLPLNPSDSTSETVYGKDENGYLAGLTKLYFNFVSNDTTDLQVSDGGASELIRAFWTIQEVTADACKCAWENDAWVRAMNTDTWSDADNDATYAVYVRTLQGIAYVNEYLRQTAYAAAQGASAVYWLRDTLESGIHPVISETGALTLPADTEVPGIRPLALLDLTAYVFTAGDGTEENPYR